MPKWRDGETVEFIIFRVHHFVLMATKCNVKWRHKFELKTSNDQPCISLQLGFAVHEIGHAIGFWHEHVRADREEYVTVNMSYVIPSRRHNYEKLDAGLVKNKDVPYDVGSLMHYTATVSIGGGVCNIRTCIIKNVQKIVQIIGVCKINWM